MSQTELTLNYARAQDEKDELRHLRNEFLIPTKRDLKRRKLGPHTEAAEAEDELSTYLCGNSLGLQPKRTHKYIDSYLSTWKSMGVYGHFKPLDEASTVPWVDIGDQAAEAVCKIVGALPSEVAVMQTLTANLHLLMASFYRPNKDRWRIILESKAFPSDHYAIYSQCYHHNLSPQEAIITLEPSDVETHYFSTEHVLDVIGRYADTTALVLLPGIHFYSGQYFDIQKITSFAHEKGITIGWDLAHAAGNVPVKLHDWNVDFAAWCSYKYLNSGPGSIAGLFVHERHGQVKKMNGEAASAQLGSASDGKGSTFHYIPRLSGWWGSDKASRFKMDNVFIPIPGAAGWQLSNPSVFDCTSVIASMSVFNETSINALREKSLKLTAYLEKLLKEWPLDSKLRKYTILTPSDPEERGAQLSVRLDEGLLEDVMEVLENEGVVVDERRPNVVRVAPAPLYNSFEDVWRFMVAFEKSLKVAVDKRRGAS
ncbi:kynureninase [Verruconis gallopava]|uniref:Kynureninase n=1 Tax=Verruconis gallopava TaxID=253628 RepID=A0A0D1Z5S3_9PEZI|nr:kynureninase [Verruconis gallopava]KIW08317.1 kynureninase [Verruconis gallopava]